VRFFVNLDEFVAWIKLLMEKGRGAIAEAGKPPNGSEVKVISETDEIQLDLVVARFEFLGSRHLGLLNRTKQLFLKSKLCSTEKPTAFVLTAFDSPEILARDYRNAVLSNVIFKPFDRLILLQHLVFAMDGRKPPSQNAFEPQKYSAVIEMLKDVQMEAISELGAITRSQREIKPGIVAKYYGNPFYAERTKSVMARALSCVPHPLFPGEYQVKLGFFAIENAQLRALRRRLHTSQNSFQALWWPESSPQEFVDFVTILPSEDQRQYLVDGVKNRFSNTRWTFYRSLTDLLVELDPKALSPENTPKAFEKGNEIEFEFDPSCRQILNASMNEFLGTQLDSIRGKANWWMNNLDEISQKSFRDWLKSPATGNSFVFNYEDKMFFLKPLSLQKSEKSILIKLQELTNEERSELLKLRGKLPPKVDYLILHESYFSGASNEKWAGLKEQIKNRTHQAAPLHLLMLASRRFSDPEEKTHSEQVEDIFFEPLDRAYFFKKIKFLTPQVKVLEDPIQVVTAAWPELIKTATPVQMTEVNEAGVGIVYSRALDPGEFREFLLWHPVETQAPELVAQCNSVEESPSEKGAYNCQFVFFGVTDSMLKSVRLWIRNSYIESKDEAS
ncbi:MAG: hypothetical protein WCH11_00465, partial [Bdellovibrio sp.]